MFITYIFQLAKKILLKMSFIYIKPKKIVFEGYEYNWCEDNLDGTQRFRCSFCNSRSISISIEKNEVKRQPDQKQQHLANCKQMGDVEIDCLVQYEKLKNEAKEDNFKFSDAYKSKIQYLHSKHNANFVGAYWPNMEKARNTINTIRRKNGTDNKNKNAQNLNGKITDEMKTIKTNDQEYPFLRYDNECLTGNRVLIFVSTHGIKLLESEEWFIDGTFKNAPSDFKQILTIQCIVQGEILPAAFILLQNKTTEAYVEAFQNLSIVCSQQGSNILPSKVLCDFESGLQKSLRYCFAGVIVKGCWFHFCQALTRKLQNLGLKTRYINDYDFRFWCKQFSALAIISTEHLKQAMDTILTNGINYKQEQAVLKFIKYFNNQWLHGSQPPDIWNHFENYEKRTNNDLEGYHSDLDKHFPKYHPSLESVVKFFKKFNALSVDRFIKIRLHQYKRVKSKQEQQKDLQFALINEEFKQKLITFEQYFEKITFACLSQHEFNSQNDFMLLGYLILNFNYPLLI